MNARSPALLTVSLVSASAVLVTSIDFRRTVATREEAIDTVVAWVRDNAEPGSTIAFGSYLGFEMGLPLRDDFRLRQVRHETVVADAEAPDGVTVFGRPRATTGSRSTSPRRT